MTGDVRWWPGTEKLGNANGVKATTAIDRVKANICYTQG